MSTWKGYLDSAGRKVYERSKSTPVIHKPVSIRRQSESDFDNYDRVRDESPFFIIGYREDFDMSSKEKEVRRIR